MILGLLFNLAILAAVGYGISRLVRQRVHHGGDGPPADLRQSVARFIRLVLLFGVVALVAEGFSQGIGDLARRADGFDGSPTTLARALAFTVVGVPGLIGLAWWTRRELATDPAEHESAGWTNYLSITTLVALAVSVPAWYSVLRTLLGSSAIDHRAIGASIAWTAAWAAHWRLWSGHRVVSSGPDLHLLGGSALGLILSAIGLGRLVDTAGRWLYHGAVGGGDVRVAALRDAAALAVVGGAVWVLYWLTEMRRNRRTPAWHAFVLLLGVLGSIITVVVGGAVALHAVLQWFFGHPAAPTAALHFDVLPGAASAVAVGLVGWRYHRAVLGRNGNALRTEIDRLYDYLTAAVGLVATTIGVTVATAALIATLVRPDGRPVANAVVLAATLVLVGAPIWGTYWRRIERQVDRDERSSPTRRTYLVLLFGASAATAMISMVVLLSIAFEGLTRGHAASPTLYRVRVPLGLVLALGALAGYHGIVALRDRRALATGAPGCNEHAAGPAAIHKVVIVAAHADACAAAIRQRLGARVEVWRPMTTPARLVPAGTAPAATAAVGDEHPVAADAPPEVDIDAAFSALEAVAAEHVLLIVRPDGRVEAIPFHEE